MTRRPAPDAAATLPAAPRVRALQRAPYVETLAAMRDFTAQRGADTVDEIWLIEHPPVFTQGLAGRDEHLLAPGDIPVQRTERGGQVTYHGPGQVLLYLLINLHRRGLGPRAFVTLIEQSLMALLSRHGISAVQKPGAPGVHVADSDGQPGAKIAALGIKISRGCSFHGAALNVDMNLEPFSRINPCGYAGLAVTDMARQLAAAGRGPPELTAVADELAAEFVRQLTARPMPASTRPPTDSSATQPPKP